MAAHSIEAVAASFQKAKTRRAPWEPVWRDCFTYAMPTRGHGLGAGFTPGANHAERLFDGTAADGVEQLAASLLAELTPPWSQWFGLRPGHAVPEVARFEVTAALEEATRRLQGHFDRSNFAVEMHQCLLDLVTVGTANLLFEEAPTGSSSAFRFTALPVSETYIDGDHNGTISRQFRVTSMSPAALRSRFPEAPLGDPEDDDNDGPIELVEAILRCNHGYDYLAFLPAGAGKNGYPIPLSEGRFEHSPFITFRWLKGTGEIYGRSPVMTALPDVKTANKVVELVLKNASIAVTGIWLAEDDGVLNPANIRLTPGSIIPKAVGTAGLTPLQAPGRFDVSELVLGDLRSRIRHTLMLDRLAPISGKQMTATEVLERGAEMTRLLGAIYGRLQGELLTPLIQRAMAILNRRGELPEMTLDGEAVELQYRSPLARVQARDDVRNTMLWLDTVSKMGPEAQATVDMAATSRWLAETLGVPDQLVNDTSPAELADLANQLLTEGVNDA